MKPIFTFMRVCALFLLLLFFNVQASALDLTFEWDAAPADFQVESYNIYERVDASTTRLLGNSTIPEFTVTGVIPGAHRYEVTLVNMWGESVVYADGETPPIFPSPMTPGKIKFRAVVVSASTDLQTWKQVALVPVPDMPGNKTFYTLTFSL